MYVHICCMVVICEIDISECIFPWYIFVSLDFYWNRYYWVRVLDVNWKIVSLPKLACKLFWKSSKFRWTFGLPWVPFLWIWSHNGGCTVLKEKVRNCLWFVFIEFHTLFRLIFLFFCYIWTSWGRIQYLLPYSTNILCTLGDIRI